MLNKNQLLEIEGKYGHEKILEDAQFEAFNAAQTTLAYREMLKELEWSMIVDRSNEGYCPICGAWNENGHMPDCKLAELLKEG